MTNSFRNFVLALGAATLVVLRANAVMAAPILSFDVTASPNPLNVPQNTTGKVTFTVTLSMGSQAPIAKGSVDFTAFGAWGIQFTGMDKNDTIGAGTLVPGGTCFTFEKGKPVGSTIFALGRSCTYVEDFPTSDARDPDPDDIPGEWTLTQAVKMTGYDAKSNVVSTGNANATFKAVVLDTPEPASLLLIAPALAALGLLRRVHRRNA